MHLRPALPSGKIEGKPWQSLRVLRGFVQQGFVPRARLGATRPGTFSDPSQMKPAAHHYLVAHTLGFLMALGAVAAIALVLLALNDEGVLVADVGVWIWALVAAVPAGLLGLIPAFIISPFAFFLATRIQGGPFAVGDEVVILTGKHKNAVATIYEIWEERQQVRVDLGEDLKRAVKDVFCVIEICRTKSADKAVDVVGDLDDRCGHSGQA